MEIDLGSDVPKSFFSRLADRGMYLYRDKRHYLREEVDFSHFLMLLKFDHFYCCPVFDGSGWMVGWFNVRDWRHLKFALSAESLLPFLFGICAQLCAVDSPFLELGQLPEPLSMCGSMLLHISLFGRGWVGCLLYI